MIVTFLKKNPYIKLACVALGIFAVSALIYKMSPSSDQAVAEPSKHDSAACNHGVGCTHNHQGFGDSQTENPATQYPVVRLQHPVVSASQSIYQSKPGDRLNLNFGDELVLDARVKVNKTFPGRQQSVSMQLLGHEGSVYWLKKADGSIMGNIILKESGKNIIYVYSGQEGDLTVRRITQQQFVCSGGDTDDSIGMPIGDAPEGPVGQSGIIPLLNSLPGATAVVYIDFDGEEVSGTRWVNGGTINAEPAGFSENRIRKVWEEVAEDMRPFKINVTTDRAVFDAAPQKKKMMCIVTPTNDALPGSGGVAYLNSFYDGSLDPCWCFNLGTGSAAQTVSHEIGHTFGLNHDGLTSQNDPEYHRGNGTWGPIMGAPFGLDVVTWSDGNYDGSTNIEDDLAIIDARSAKFRDDQYGDTGEDAYGLGAEEGETGVDLEGVIEKPEDIDVFSFTTSGGAASLRVNRAGIPSNMNLKIELYDETGNLIVESDPQNSYDALFTTELEPGNYFINVEGTGSGSPDVSGFSDYGSIGLYELTGTIEGLGGLIVNIEQPQLDKVSIADGNGLVLAASVIGPEDSVNWRATSAPSGGRVTFDDSNSEATKVFFSAPGRYTLRFRAALGSISTDKSINVSVETASQPKVYANRGPVVKIEPADLYYSRQGLITGQVSDDGVPSSSQPAYKWRILSGEAQITNPTSQRPTVVFGDNQPSVITLESSDGQITTFAQAKVQSFYEERILVDKQTSGRWFIPKNNDLGLGWIGPAFDDSSWNQGPTGFGYDQDGRYSAYIGNGTDLKSSMKGQSSSAYLRIPFSLPQLDYVQGLKLWVNYNDAFVAYINGVEVARRNAPGGELSWESAALSVRSQQAARFVEEIDLVDVQSRLNTGENILAIHGMNNAAADGDFLVNPVIQAELIASPFFTFLERYGLALDPNELPAGDHDEDNNINLVEHALDTDPTAANGDFYPLKAGSSSNGSIKITLPIDAPEDIDYRIERAREGVEAQNWEVIATKRGPGAWTGNSIFAYIDKKVGGNVTYSLRELNTAPDPSNLRLYRLGYSLRGPGGNTAPN